MRKTVSAFFHSIRLRLVTSYLFVSFLAVGLVGLLGMELVHRNALEREKEYLTLYAEMERDLILPFLKVEDYSKADLQSAADFVAGAGGLRVKVLTPEGEIIADSRQYTPLSEIKAMAERMAEGRNVKVIVTDEEGNLIAEAGSGSETIEIIFPLYQNTPTDGDEEGTGTRLFQLEAGTLLEEAVPVVIMTDPSRSSQIKILPVDETNPALGTVEVSEGPNFTAYAMDSAQEAFTIAGSVAVLASLAVGIFASTRVSAPLRHLAGIVEKMREGELGVQTPYLGKDEVGILSAKINEMSSQLEASFQQIKTERDTLKRFVADASHELRTPITALGMFLELLEDPNCDPQEQHELVVSSQAEINRLTWITGNLLDLSRLDAGMVKLNLEAVPVSELLDTIITENSTQASEKGVHLHYVSPDPGLVLDCDRQQLIIALTNIIDNAVKFSKRDGIVRIGTDTQPGRFTIWVEDTGTGIPAEDLPHIFERFYRGKDRSVPGSGLGLAIVKSIAELHGGSVTIVSTPNQGTRAAIHLPFT